MDAEAWRIRQEEEERVRNEIIAFGCSHPEFAAMNLPSLRPAFLFLLKIPLDLVHEGLKLRAGAGKRLRLDHASDALTLKQVYMCVVCVGGCVFAVLQIKTVMLIVFEAKSNLGILI